MTAALFERHRVIDIDTHVTEPRDVFTSRIASKWRDQVPQVREVEGRDLWLVGDTVIGMPGAYSMAGHNGTPPDFPKTYAEIDASMIEPKARLEFMNKENIYANVLYPNVGGFGAAGFLRLDDAALMIECVRVYNDFLLEWASADPTRLVPVMSTPFWDVEASVKEIERCAGLGYRAVLMCNQPQDFNMPFLRDKHWDPIWAAAEAAGMSISFHIGGGDLSDLIIGVVSDTITVGID